MWLRKSTGASIEAWVMRKWVKLFEMYPALWRDSRVAILVNGGCGFGSPRDHENITFTSLNGTQNHGLDLVGLDQTIRRRNTSEIVAFCSVKG